MKCMKLAIIDDNIEETKKLIFLITQLFSEEHWPFSVDIYHSIPDDLTVLQDVSLLFLDLEIGKASGILLGKQLQRKYPALRIVITSSFPQYLTEGYKTGACRYFLKPLEKERFESEMRDLMNSPAFIQETGIHDPDVSSAFIPFKSISYIDYMSRKARIHLSNGRIFATPYPLHEWEKRTEDLYFCRISKSCLVNLRHVHHYLKADGMAILNDGTKLSVSRSERKRLSEELSAYAAACL